MCEGKLGRGARELIFIVAPGNVEGPNVAPHNFLILAFISAVCSAGCFIFTSGGSGLPVGGLESGFCFLIVPTSFLKILVQPEVTVAVLF